MESSKLIYIKIGEKIEKILIKSNDAVQDIIETIGSLVTPQGAFWHLFLPTESTLEMNTTHLCILDRNSCKMPTHYLLPENLQSDPYILAIDQDGHEEDDDATNAADSAFCSPATPIATPTVNATSTSGAPNSVELCSNENCKKLTQLRILEERVQRIEAGMDRLRDNVHSNYPCLDRAAGLTEALHNLRRQMRQYLQFQSSSSSGSGECGAALSAEGATTAAGSPPTSFSAIPESASLSNLALDSSLSASASASSLTAATTNQTGSASVAPRKISSSSCCSTISACFPPQLAQTSSPTQTPPPPQTSLAASSSVVKEAQTNVDMTGKSRVAENSVHVEAQSEHTSAHLLFNPGHKHSNLPTPNLAEIRPKPEHVSKAIDEFHLLCDLNDNDTWNSINNSLNEEINAAIQQLYHAKFNNWKYSDGQLIYFVLKMFEELNFIDQFQLDLEKIKKWLITLYQHYNSVPFHNFKHAFMVTQMMFVLINHAQLVSKLDQIDILILIVSSICHDLDHPGFNNAFQINSGSQLAVRYNDQSPLENHHTAMAFDILSRPGCNMFAHLDVTIKKYIRDGIIRCILATDMSKHNEILSQYLDIIEEFSFTDRRHLNLLMKILMKVADISNESRPLKVAAPWIDLLLQEFFTQSDYEKEQGLPFAPFMDRNIVHKASSQCSFISFVILPLFKPLSTLFPQLKDIIIESCLTQLDYYTRLDELTSPDANSNAKKGLDGKTPVSNKASNVSSTGTSNVSCRASISLPPLPPLINRFTSTTNPLESTSAVIAASNSTSTSSASNSSSSSSKCQNTSTSTSQQKIKMTNTFLNQRQERLIDSCRRSSSHNFPVNAALRKKFENSMRERTELSKDHRLNTSEHTANVNSAGSDSGWSNKEIIEAKEKEGK